MGLTGGSWELELSTRSAKLSSPTQLLVRLFLAGDKPARCHSTGAYQPCGHGTRGTPTSQQQLRLTALPPTGLPQAEHQTSPNQCHHLIHQTWPNLGQRLSAKNIRILEVAKFSKYGTNYWDFCIYLLVIFIFYHLSSGLSLTNC